MRRWSYYLLVLTLVCGCTAIGARPTDSDVGPSDGGSDSGVDAREATDVPEEVSLGDTEADVPLDAEVGRDVPTPPTREFAPSSARLHRLSSDQLRTTIQDLLGVSVTGALEEDTSLHGFVSVAGGELTIAPRTAEQIESVAWEAADAVGADAELRASLLGCEVTDEFCVRDWILRFGRRAWRRPLSADELEQIHATSTVVAERFSDPWAGVGAAIAVFLQSPHFVFRVEIGEADPERAEWRRYTSWEMASRLSYFLWGTAPDEVLLSAAEGGELVTDVGVRDQALRMMDDPRARTRLTAFFDEYIGLQRLDGATKDPELFPEYDADLAEAMRREVQLMFQDVAFDNAVDFRQILTTDRAFVDARLAPLYGLSASGEEPQRVELPPDSGRGGLLGRAALLTLFSHATVTSPTFRGRFVRASLLCHDVPPPPDGVITELPEPDGTPRTLRQRLEIHATEPLCAGCHDLMDPLGFPFEQFDPIGRSRELDNGLPIDTSGELDGVVVENAAELGAALADHPGFGACVTRRLYRHATGHLEELGEFPLLAELGERFADEDYLFQRLVLQIVLSDGFRKAAAPRGIECDDNGAVRACEFGCGAGEETCVFGEWTGCDAAVPAVELCNGVDDDCDGTVDEAIVARCSAACGPGTTSCDGGSWRECAGAAPVAELCDGLDQDCDGIVDEEVSAAAELCDGVDQDCDGRVDEDIASRYLSASYWDLSLSHPDCSSSTERIGRACNAAIHRRCGNHECASTGFGPVELGSDTANIVCLTSADAAVHETTYTDLSAQHPGCHAGTRSGSDCNAAMHRWCAARGETSGYGPLENSDDRAWVACTPRGVVVWSTYTELGGHHASCPPERVGPNCNSAINRFCQSRGFLSGFGPIENSGDSAVVTCIPRP